MATDVQYLANKIQAGLILRLHRLGANAVGIHAAQSDLGGSITFCTGRL